MIIYKFNTILFYLFVLTGLQSCEEASNSSSNPGSALTEISKFKNKPPETKPSISGDIPSSLLDWSALNDLAKAITDISNGKYQLLEDTEEALKTLFSKLESDIPNTLNTPSILARFKVLETLAYKLRTKYNIDRDNSTEFEPTKESLVEAYSNLIFQISKTLEKESQLISKPK